jgi:hypothetical protein
MKVKDFKNENYITIGDFLLFKDKLLGKGSYGNIYLGKSKLKNKNQ